jgi:hypothetical protein
MTRRTYDSDLIGGRSLENSWLPDQTVLGAFVAYCCFHVDYVIHRHWSDPNHINSCLSSLAAAAEGQ